MHVALTDVLTCPRCGPEFGLLLLAEQTENRRVFEGWLGCANCREQYRVSGGYADLSYRATEQPSNRATEQGETDALRIAALLGVTEGPGFLMIVGPGAAQAGAVADMIEGVEVIALSPSVADGEERPGVSRIGAGTRIPFRSASVRGVALTGAGALDLLAEAARVAAFRARVVLFSEGVVVERLEALGLRVIAKDERVTVAERTSF